MARMEWTLEETAVLLFFCSRGVSSKGIASLILLKCRSRRDVESIHGRKAQIRREEERNGQPNLYDERTKMWLIAGVDAWLLSHDIEGLRELTSLGQEERHQLSQVSFFFQILV